MPIHDWTRVRANRFHDFHQRWSVAISNSLNRGLLPEGFFAMVEQKTGGSGPDVIALQSPGSPPRRNEGGTIAAPQVRFTARSAMDRYARRANRITVRHPDGNLVAVIEIVSPGNKSSRDAIRQFTRKAVEFLRSGIHVLVIDLLPPNRRNPQGIHPEIWNRIEDGEPFELPAEQQLTLVSYFSGMEVVAYIEPVAVGQILPDMAVFLTPDDFVYCPLEASYATAWEQFPEPLKGPLVNPQEPSDA